MSTWILDLRDNYMSDALRHRDEFDVCV